MRTATGNAVLRAYSAAMKHITSDAAIGATETSAGFVIPGGGRRGQRVGYQVFVKVHRFSECLLTHQPESGGLICNARTAPRRERKPK